MGARAVEARKFGAPKIIQFKPARSSGARGDALVPYSHVHNSSALTAQAAKRAIVSATCTPSLRMLSIILMTRKASGDSGRRVSKLIFPGIQDSFTFDSRLAPTAVLRSETTFLRRQRNKKAGEIAGLSTQDVSFLYLPQYLATTGPPQPKR